MAPESNAALRHPPSGTPTAYAHGGNVHAACARWGGKPGDWLDLSASINPLGPPDPVREALGDATALAQRYPDPDATPLRAALAQQIGCSPGMVVAGNGATDLLFLLPIVFGWRRALVLEPGYIDIRRSLEAAGCEPLARIVPEEGGFAAERVMDGPLPDGVEAVFLGSPNNPTGHAWEPGRLMALCRAHPSVTFVVDQSFAPFLEPPARWQVAGAASLPNLLVLASLTKFFALPGLRLGYVWGPVSLVSRLAARVPPWSVNALAQAAGVAALSDARYGQRTRESLRAARAQLLTGLSRIPGVVVYPPTVNFVLCRLATGTTAVLQEHLAAQRVLVRDAANVRGLTPAHFRVAVRGADENARGLEAIGRAAETLRTLRARGQGS